MAIYLADELECCGCGVTHEDLLEGGGVGVLECSQKCIAECGINFLNLVVLTAFLCMLSDDLLLVKRGFPRWDGGCLTMVGQVDE